MKEQADEHLQMNGKNMIAVEVAFISIDASSGAPILFFEGDGKRSKVGATYMDRTGGSTLDSIPAQG